MTLPTQTWRISPLYNLGVSVVLSVADILKGIKAMFDAEDAIGNNYWTYSLYDVTGNPRHMIFKRKGTPSGTLATFRACMFANVGAATINAANLGVQAAAAATNNLYLATSATHNADVVTNECDVGVVMGGQFCPGQLFTVGNTVTSTMAPKVFIVECDKMCSIWITTTVSINAARCCVFGELCERAKDGVGLWGFTTNGIADWMDGTQTSAEATGVVSPIAAMDSVTTTTAHGAGTIFDDFAKAFFRLPGPASATVLDGLQNYDNDTAVVVPIIMGGKRASGGVSCVGVLRQIRYTIRNTGRQELRDASNVTKGYLINSGFSSLGRGLFYDNAP